MRRGWGSSLDGAVWCGRVRFITFHQTLLAVGLVGLTLMLAVGWELILWISIGHSAGSGPSPIGPVTMLAVAFALALAVIVVAARRLRASAADHPLAFGELLVVVGVLGLLVTALLASQSVVTMATAEWYRDPLSASPAGREFRFLYSEDTGNLRGFLPPHMEVFNLGGPFRRAPSYGSSVALQVVAFLLPLLVLGLGMWKRWREASGPAGEARSLEVSHVAMALVLFGLVIACANSPVAMYIVSAENSSYFNDLRYGSRAIDLGFFAAGFGGPALALAILLGWRRGFLGTDVSPLLPVVVGVAALTTASAAASHSLSLLALVVGIMLAGYLWANGLGGTQGNEGRSRVTTGQLLVAVAAIGLAMLVVAMPSAIDLIARWRLIGQHSPEQAPYGLLTVMPALACAINFGLLALSLRYLRAAREGTREGA